MAVARSARLDLLRALSVLLVLGRHFELSSVPLQPSWLDTFVRTWQRGGWVGVDMFFVLSGFLVSGLLFRDYQRDGHIRPWRFLLRRGLKIYPAFWVLVGATAILWPKGATPWPAPVTRTGVLSELLFVQNYAHGMWNHTWSLAVEEHFYLLLVAIIAWRATLPNGLACLPRVTAGICIVVLAMRVETALQLGRPALFFPIQTHLRIDALAGGVGLSYAYHMHRDQLLTWTTAHRLWLFACGMGLMSIPFIWTLESGWAITAVGLSGVYFGAAAILLASFTVPEPTSRAVGALAFLGSHSYSIYIWHMAVNTALLTLGLAWWTYAASYLICSLIIGVAFAILIEFPILRVRDRLWPDRVQPEEPWSGATLHSF